MSIESPPANGKPRPILGCIADDVTGATDLALNLVQGGMRVVQWLRPPSELEPGDLDADAIVVALKTRSVAPDVAIQQSLSALTALRKSGCQRFYFKYCSTFDSTDTGNIGPVAEALLQELNSPQSIFCPAFPAAGRTVYSGQLFVNGRPLHESGMQHHPLNPMRDSDLVRVLGRQARKTVGLIDYHVTSKGPQAIKDKLTQTSNDDESLIIVDALDEQSLNNIAIACADMPLVTGGSGLARFLPEAYRSRGLLSSSPTQPSTKLASGRTAILSGSCSQATRHQIGLQKERSPSMGIDVVELMQFPELMRQSIVSWVDEQPREEPVMIYSTDTPANVSNLQNRFGQTEVANQVEALLAGVAKSLVNELGVTRLIVAGGETSSAVANALGVKAIRIGPEIAPGVPWTESLDDDRLAFAFKSGNFGGDNFFQDALEMLQ